MALRTGVVILPDLPWQAAAARWRAAEECGFHTAWTYDHLSWRTLRDGPWLGAVPLLAAAAASTTALRLGTLVTSANFRHPALLAKDAMTLDQISGGRFDLGIGAGGTGWDASALGGRAPTAGERTARFEDFTAGLDVMLRETSGSYAGPHFQAPEYRTLPGCVQQPRLPFTIAATGPRGLSLAAEYAACWVTFGPIRDDGTRENWYASVSDQARRLDVACELRGREPAGIRRMARQRAGRTSPPALRRWASRTSSSTGPGRMTHTFPAPPPQSSTPSATRCDRPGRPRRPRRARDRCHRARVR